MKPDPKTSSGRLVGEKVILVESNQGPAWDLEKLVKAMIETCNLMMVEMFQRANKEGLHNWERAAQMFVDAEIK